MTLLLKKRLFSSPEAFATTLGGPPRDAGEERQVRPASDKRAVQLAIERMDEEAGDDAEIAPGDRGRPPRRRAGSEPRQARTS